MYFYVTMITMMMTTSINELGDSVFCYQCILFPTIFMHTYVVVTVHVIIDLYMCICTCYRSNIYLCMNKIILKNSKKSYSVFFFGSSLAL